LSSSDNPKNSVIKSEKMHPRKLWPDSKVIKFLCTGLLNTAFGYGLYSVLLYAGVPYLLALLISTIAGIAFNYLSFGRLVFKVDRSWVIFGRFVLAYASIYCVNAVLLTQLMERFFVGPYLGQVICIPVGVAMSWVVMKHWVYKIGG
jgi:putative flippase GtrA